MIQHLKGHFDLARQSSENTFALFIGGTELIKNKLRERVDSLKRLLDDKIFDDFAKDVGQSIVSTTEAIRELFVMDAQLMQDGRVQVV